MPIVDPGPQTYPTAPALEVSWQTCIWILITLALNTMFQPCGRVCDFDSCHRTYLRSSPFTCLADLLSILIRLISISLTFKISPLGSFEMLLVERFSMWEEVPEAKQGTWVRWLLFILGPLPQAIRLASFNGLVWTKIFGFSYLISFLVLEMFIFVTPVDKIKTRWRPWSADDGRYRLDTRYEQTLEALGVFDWCLSMIAILLVPVGLFGSGVVSFVDLIWRLALPESYGFHGVAGTVLSYYMATFIVVMGIATASTIIPLFSTALVSFLHKFCAENPRTGMNLLLLSSDQAGSYRAIETAFWTLLFFLVNLIACVMGYAYKYNPSGTENPGWTTVFG